MTQFEQTIKKTVTCDICGEIMHPLWGGGWDNDRLRCAARDCGAEIVFPTSSLLVGIYPPRLKQGAERFFHSQIFCLTIGKKEKLKDSSTR